MKKILLSVLLIASFAYTSKLRAQISQSGGSCTVSSPIISNIVTSNNGGSCTITFDLSFDFTGNNGNKWKAIYIWTDADYAALPSNFYGSNGLKVPSSTDLNGSNALASVVICTDSSATFSLYKYPNNATNPTTFKQHLAYLSSGSTLTIKGISVTVANCNTQVNLKADVGSTNAQSFSQFGCLAHGVSFTANEPIIQAVNFGCGSTRQLAITFITTQARTINFGIYKDSPADGLFTAADTTTSGNLVGGPYSTTTTFDAVHNDWRSTGLYNYTVGPAQKFNVWVVAYTSGIPNVSVAFADNSCFPLPVKLTFFNAKRNNASTVGLTWQTAQEINSRGFEIQRLIGSGGWQVVGFVPTQSPNGNSSMVLNYTFTDNNNAHAITQYRLRAVDIDENSKYSEIRAVRGEGQAGKIIVYPNPSFDGKAKVVFDDMNGTRDVSLMDISGRVIKQWMGVTNNNLEIDNLTPGLYNLRVIIRETGDQSIEKIIVSRR